MFRHRSFWIILIITAFVWLMATMSEHSDYTLPVKLRWEGFDSARYVVSNADTALTVTINADAFQAISFFLTADRQPFAIRVQGDTVLKVNSLLLNSLIKQFQQSGIKDITSPVETLRLTLAERHRKGYCPTLKQTQFQFADQCGLYGSPVIEPDTVWLFGDSATLDKITQLTTQPATISGITDSGWYTLALDPVWTRYRDIHSSTDSIRLFLPVIRYVETTITVPVTTPGVNPSIGLRTIPERVNVTLWVPSNLPDIAPSQVQAEVSLPAGNADDKLPVRITRFPDLTRVKQVNPPEVQYVIIKNK